MAIIDSRIIFMRRVSSLLLASTAFLWLTLVDRRSGASATRNLIADSAFYKVPRKPTIYTFQENLPSPDKVNEELKLWQLSWKQAGWEANVITFDDALRHPDFDTFERALGEIMPFGRRPEKMGYYRFLAMAVTGGGFLADVDVLPIWHLSPTRRESVVQDEFTVRCGSSQIAPCLMSGSGDEWNRISVELLSSIHRNYKLLYQTPEPDDNLHAVVPTWNSIYALQEVVGFGNAHGRPMARKKQQVLSARQAYEMSKSNSFSKEDCSSLNDRLAVQFSATLTEGDFGNLDTATRWIQQWKRDCVHTLTIESTNSSDTNATKEVLNSTRYYPYPETTPLAEVAAAALPQAHVARLLVRNK